MTITENTIELAERSVRMGFPTDSERAAVKALCIAARKYEDRIKELEEALKGTMLEPDCWCDAAVDGHDEWCTAARKALGIETKDVQ